MFGQLLLRFILGGTIVSLFAVAGSTWQPKNFAGIFSGAPSVALVSLALACLDKSSDYVAVEGRSMILGAVSLVTYSCACIVLGKQQKVAVGIGAFAAWIVWLGVALSSVALLRLFIGAERP
jgi:hypothetical protein